MHEPRRVLVTGGCGFIGSNLIRHLLATDPTLQLLNVDALTYAGNPRSLDGLPQGQQERLGFLQADIRNADAMRDAFASFQPDTVIHLAAESHVDRSIDGPAVFLETNIMGTYVLLAAALEAWRGWKGVRFHHVSTDEVFGSLGSSGLFTETTPYDPSSPYSASKASSDHLVRAWARTYGLPVTISNCSNNYGPYQFPEKLIPLMIRKGLAGEPLPVYGDGSNVRDWLHVEDHCSAINAIVRRAEDGSTWCVSGDNEISNLDVVGTICDILDELRPSTSARRALITFVRDRPGHDQRYAIDATKLREGLSWGPSRDFSEGLRETIAWYLERSDWIESVLDGSYRGERLGMGGA